MRQRMILIGITIVIYILTVGACRREQPTSETPKADTSQMELMYTTAYCLQGTTATGGTTRPGIAACNTHVGDMAMIYGLDGEYLGMYEITDRGATDGLKNGTVIDVWEPDYDQCKSWMELTGGRVYVLWIHGEG